MGTESENGNAELYGGHCRGKGGRPLEAAVLQAVGGFVALVGLFTLIAWRSESTWVAGALPPAVRISAGTALGLALSGGAVLLQTVRGRAATCSANVALVLAAAAGFLAILTLLEHAFGLHLWTHTLAVADLSSPLADHSRPMGANSAVCLLFSAVCAAILGRGTGGGVRNVTLAWLGALNTGISLVALVAHLEAARAGYNWLNMVSMSVPAAVLYAIQGSACVWVAAKRACFRWALGRAQTFKFVNGVALLFGVALLGYLSAIKFGEATGEIKASGRVLAKIAELREAVDALDVGFPGSGEAATPDPGRPPHGGGPLVTDSPLDWDVELSRSARAGPEQTLRVTQLREALGRWRNLQREAMTLLTTQGAEAAQRKLLTQDARQCRAQIHGLLSVMADVERQGVSSSETRLYRELERTFGLLPFGALVGTLVLSYGAVRLSMEMDRREQISKALSLAEERQRLAVEAAGIGDWELDPVTHVIIRSARHDQIFGYSEPPAEWTYETFLQHVHPEDRDRVDSLYRQTIEEAGEWTTECRIRRKDGTARWIWLRGRCFKDKAGRVETVRGVLGDVTERRAAEDQIRSLNASLEERVRERTEKLELAVKELDAFTYSVSHDLRAPLRAINGFSKLLIEDHSDQLSEEARRKLGIISSEAQRMSRLIDDLLSFSRLGRAQVHPEQIDMQALAKEVFEGLQELGTNCRKIDFTLHPMPAAMGTQPMVRQVWTNLMSNALKFTRGREVAQIEVGCRSDAQGNNAYYIKDNGVGFDMRHAGNLFGVFQRLHSDKEFEGTGAGLALVQRIVNRHGGRVWAEAAQDKGATFFFTLPTPNV